MRLPKTYGELSFPSLHLTPLLSPFHKAIAGGSPNLSGEVVGDGQDSITLPQGTPGFRALSITYHINMSSKWGASQDLKEVVAQGWTG